jgi:hypothetical protein
MNLARIVKRNKLRKKVGNKKLRKSWRNLRIKEVGLIPYMIEYNRTTKSHLSPKEIYY